MSTDGERDWRPFAEDARAEVPNMWATHSVQGPPTAGRYLRITLLAWPEGASPGIAEIVASGTIASP